MSGAEGTLPTGMAGLRYPITQVSLAVHDLDQTMDLYHRAFGWAPWQVFDHVRPIHHNTELRGEPVHYAIRGAEVYVGSLNFELLQPLEGRNLWTEFIDRRGEGVASIATMFQEGAEGDAVKRAFRERFGAEVIMKADIGDHIEYFYLDTERAFGCLIESGSGHAIDFMKPAQVHPREGALPGPSPMSGLTYPITQVSLVSRDLEERVRAYREAFGWAPWKLYEPEALIGLGSTGLPDGQAVRLAQTMVGDLNFEIIQPLGGPTPWQEQLDAKGEGLAGISVTLGSTEEMDLARAQFDALGVGVLAGGAIADTPWLLLDSEPGFKCLIQVSLGHSYDLLEPTFLL
jgi:catechol 2,3-dioxygenase-like lactoylglutathione lyase family enzyme